MNLLALKCRACGADLVQSMVDLGDQPLANNYAETAAAAAQEPRYALHARVCRTCRLVQVADVVPPEVLFRDYSYLSSYSESWLEHARVFSEASITRFGLTPESFVLEIASNDGYLLRHFKERAMRVLGVEPAENVASIARDVGIPTETVFFGPDTVRNLTEKHGVADLVVANNVFAHVPDPVGFARAVAEVLAAGGVASFEFPHLLRLIEGMQFDTIYHEHFSYFSLRAAEAILESAGLMVIDVEQLPTHGGSLRLTIARRIGGGMPSERVLALRAAELRAGLDTDAAYESFSAAVASIRSSFMGFLDDARSTGASIAAYGAAAKGNTFLNFTGATADDVRFVVDRNPLKQNRYLPGSAIPVVSPEHLQADPPKFLLVLPWNLVDEVRAQTVEVRELGTQLVTAIPTLRIHD